MKIQKLFLFICFIATFSDLGIAQAFAKQAQSKKQFCSLRLQPGYFNQLAYDSENHMAFPNHGGLKNKGVCWWHALYQRAAWYLVVFRPELPKPTTQQAAELIHQIAAGTKIVEIPGYSNFYYFSRDFKSEIQAKLEEWQQVDGFLKFAWIEGLKGNNVVPPAEIEQQIELIYKSTNVDQNIQWVMLQMPGISSHGILSVDVIRHPGGAQIEIVDNNFVGQIKALLYSKGAETIASHHYGQVSPYLGRRKDLTNFSKAADRYCHVEIDKAAALKDDLDNGLD